MFKVMIVDDEPMTRKGLETLIDWEFHGFEIVQTAASGGEALEKYSHVSPDLMIIDIRMPKMSGLELIERIREADQSIFFLILSGYAEFDYAKKAITHNVEGYMLKPVDEDELINYLGNIHKKLEERIKENEENKNKMFHAAFTGNSTKEVKDFFHYYLDWDQYQILLIELFNHNKVDTIRLKQELQKTFEGSNHGLVFTIQPYLGILINRVSENEKGHKRLYRYLQKVLSDGDHIDFTAAIAQPVKRVKDLSNSYQLVSNLMKNQFFYEEKNLLHVDTLPFFQVKNDNFKHEEKFQSINVVEKLYYAIEIGDKHAIEEICMEAGSHMVYLNYTKQLIKVNYVQIISSLLNKLLYEYQDMQTVISNALSRVFEIEKQTKIKSLLSYVNSLLEEIIENMDMNNNDVLVKRMIGLIERNYHENIRLAKLAEVFNYNGAYLGKLFKDFTGEYFNTYLDRIRIENGKRLLLEGHKVYEVAERVGYSNVDYFYSKFRNYVGVSPSVYRKINQTNSR
ncbi:MAG TPA: response regulator transcription factor [Pseudogracilibacillus sp.]|nr:response regulator transcription factor [Pseudogracilibacillus sp.]